jgi:two-component system, NarL family, response regulator LiaR
MKMTAIDAFRDEGWAGLAARLFAEPERPEPVRVLVVDDHVLFAEMLALALDLDGSFDVVGHARNGHEAIEQAAWLRPDLVVMDVQMPVLDGIDATPLVLAAAPRAKVVVVSSSQAPEDRRRAREAGAVAFLGKEASTDELVRALERVVFQVVPLRRRRPPSASADQPSMP